jgi:DNA-binding MarR family transcriptional regulator
MCPLDGSGHGPNKPFLTDLLACTSHVLTQGFAKVLRERGVSLPVWRVMAALLARSGETVSGLAKTCLLQQPTMTKLLDRMVRDGLIARSHDPRDRRVVHIMLTPAGQARAAELTAEAVRYEAKVLSRHPQAEGIRPVLRDIIAQSARHTTGGVNSRDEEGA